MKVGQVDVWVFGSDGFSCIQSAMNTPPQSNSFPAWRHKCPR